MIYIHHAVTSCTSLLSRAPHTSVLPHLAHSCSSLSRTFASEPHHDRRKRELLIMLSLVALGATAHLKRRLYGTTSLSPFLFFHIAALSSYQFDIHDCPAGRLLEALEKSLPFR
ncbi:hypothetical protein IE81DRAFT_225740 [Ceraceosorus guamensis]|uniref:Uncharacterized protein n=1 Tax=Ceraceosorus guamensis TaxID=1522189 RepID=A0A316W5S6_9BASI|nr:hypothetical protein IE81DRAFT_225740 [Ceraceosorus guamensis]PWN45014.1 hypothetical protein IE81DRAFT_225740 [Ceraceosorus guamensis]